MISIRNISDVPLHDVLKRSPVAHIPDAEAILRECVYRSTKVRYGFLDSRLACMWGLIPPSLLSQTAYLWLLTTDIVAEHKFLFVRHSQRYVEEALKIYPTIVGDVIIGNAPARRWLKWLGAEFGQPDKGRVKFVIRRKVLQ
jgi:hypothetical protein